MKFIKQCKGIDANKANIQDSEMFYSSIKYDGIYVQIHKLGDTVKFFTSSGKEFYCSHGEEFKKLDFDFKVEAEYCVDFGKLGTRFKADNEIKKAVKDSSFQLTGAFVIFDSLEDTEFEKRLITIDKFSFSSEFYRCVNHSIVSYKEAKQKIEALSTFGWEGLFLIKASHIQVEGKKSRDAFKLKNKFTADLTIVSIDGIYLSLVDNENGLTAKVSVGKDVAEMVNIGDIIEIEYEQIVKTYNHPVFKQIRYDKMA